MLEMIILVMMIMLDELIEGTDDYGSFLLPSVGVFRWAVVVLAS